MNPLLDPTTPTPSTGEASDAPKSDSSPSEPTTKRGGQDPHKPRRPRGFAAMDRTRVSEIASKGGKAAHAAGTAHQFSSDEARNAGKKGGVAPHVRRGRGPRTSSAPSSASEPNKKEGAQSG